jgi:hypothetical protein
MSALFSVHAHALGGGQLAVNPIDLPLAATVLQCDYIARAAGASSRKRRVVAELAAYGRLKRFDTAIATLGADLAAIRTAVQAKYPVTYFYLLHNPAVLEMIVSNMIADDPTLGGLAAPAALPRGAVAVTDPALVCDWKQEQPFAVWNIGPTITVDGKISVDVPATRVEKNVDPQRWDTCSKFWDTPDDATMTVDVATNGTDYQKQTSPPASGSDYGERLFEHFVCSGTGCLAFFDNLLQVKTWHGTVSSQPSLKGYVVSYSLPPKADLDGCIGSTDKGCPGGTVVHTKTDQGWLEVFQENGRTSVVTHKEVKFDNAVANGIAQALLTYDELARELMEVACCLKASE